MNLGGTKRHQLQSKEKVLSFQRALIDIAMGERPAQQYFKGGTLLNVFTGELLQENIAVYGDRIAYVGTSEKMIGGKTRVYEVSGTILVPGYMDPHAHTDLFYNPATFSEEVALTGTTSVFSDMHDLSNALGLSGFRQVLKDAPNYPITFYTAVPSSSPPFPGIEGKEMFSLGKVSQLLRKPEALGLSEMTAFVRILNKEPRLLKILAQAKDWGKTIEGHTTGVSHDKLNALINAGITSCHESITAKDVKKRLRLGLYVLCRGGSIRNDLPHLMEAAGDLSDYDTSRILLTPDGLFPGEIARFGYMDHVINQVIELGIEPARAFQMATINPARYFNLDREQGALAPGRRADILFLSDLRRATPGSVMAKGKWVVRNGKRVFPTLSSFPTGTFDRPFSLPKLKPEFFQFRVRGWESIPTIAIRDKTLTRREDRQVQDAQGMVQARPEEDLAKIALIPRQGGQVGMGLVSGFGARIGAIASSIAHETHNLMVLGFSDRDMALAINQVVKMKGGIVIVQEGKILAQLSLPIGGIMSALRVQGLARELEQITTLLKNKGSTLEDPLWTLGFLSFTSLIELRITLSGVYEVKTGKILYNGWKKT